MACPNKMSSISSTSYYYGHNYYYSEIFPVAMGQKKWHAATAQASAEAGKPHSSA